MKLRLANAILEAFPQWPQTRPDQETMYRSVYGGRLQGRPIRQVSDKQLRAVTRRMHESAIKVESEEIRAMRQEDFVRDYKEFLLQVVPTDPHRNYTIGELEEQLLQ